jgi:hypothetical protein
MAITYLKHEVHGTKIAYMEAEVEADAQNGWIEYNPDTPAEPTVVAAPVNELEVKRRRKE